MGAPELLASLAAAGLSVTSDGDRLVIQPASKLTDAMRIALRETKPAMLALLAANQTCDTRAVPALVAVAGTDQAIARSLAVRTRLLRWKWAQPEVEFIAERLLRRDREQDERVSCVECRHYVPGRCRNYRRAGLSTSEVGRDLASLFQRCTGFQSGQSA